MALYDPSLEKDNCGFGLIAQMEGQPSHKLVRTAISALDRMTHRGGIAADGKTGDGCGLLLQKPDSYLRIIAEENNFKLGKQYAVGMIFFSQDPIKAQSAQDIVNKELAQETLTVAGWRVVPTNTDVLGPIAKDSVPNIQQVFISAPAGWRERDIERRLYIARRRIEKQITEDKDFYICSLSTQVMVYKGLCMPADLPRFYLDLADLRMESAICLFHQRFSTNTQPRWPLAQPFRYLAHNGEINTIEGNRQWAKARAYKFSSPLLPDLQTAAPFVNETGSDSSSLDNMLDLFLAGGMDVFRAMRMLVPSLKYVMIEYDVEDTPPQFTAMKSDMPVAGLEHETFCDLAMIKVKDLEKLGADGLKVMGGSYNLTPVPGVKTLKRFTECSKDEETDSDK